MKFLMILFLLNIFLKNNQDILQVKRNVFFGSFSFEGYMDFEICELIEFNVNN